ncbi:hypothetical protein cypCar_00004923 [Cyprinus carpio]|nr:hypothetical protein cypCar_00004923 [Cyprinus carpio]
MKKHSVGRRLQRRYAALGRSYSCLLVQNPSFTKSAAVMTGSEISHVLKEGELEKRSDNLLQFWKRKTCVLTTDSLNIYTDNQKKNKSKELKLPVHQEGWGHCWSAPGFVLLHEACTTRHKELTSGARRGELPGMPHPMALIDFQNRSHSGLVNADRNRRTLLWDSQEEMQGLEAP